MKQYEIIYADPPWSYRFRKCSGAAEDHYPVMRTEDICQLPVGQLAAPDCALFLWATFPQLPAAFEVIRAWGFTYKTAAFTWIKQNRKSPGLYWGMGNWTRSNAEICLLAARGQPKRIDRAVHQVVIAPVREHSRKPDEARARIVRLMGELPRVELFARQEAEGWDVWGNEVDCSFSMPDSDSYE